MRLCVQLCRLTFSTFCARCGRQLMRGAFPNDLDRCRYCGGVAFRVVAHGGPASIRP